MAEVKQIKTTNGTYDIDAKYWNGKTTLKTIGGNTLFGSGDIPVVQAVDTGDVLDDVNTNYATVDYVDGLVGDINSVLESIINGGGVSLITFTIEGTEYQAEEGMTWEQWVNSEYNTSNYNNGGDIVVDARGSEFVYNVTPSDIILSNGVYELTPLN